MEFLINLMIDNYGSKDYLIHQCCISIEEILNNKNFVKKIKSHILDIKNNKSTEKVSNNDNEFNLLMNLL
jgi:hypothetical protein